MQKLSLQPAGRPDHKGRPKQPQRQRGVALPEYALIMALMVLASIFFIQTFGNQLSGYFMDFANLLQAKTNAIGSP